MHTWQYFIVGLCEHLAWPAVVIFCVLLFRKDICKLLTRITKLPGGAELNPETVAIAQEQQKNKSNLDELIAQKDEKKQDKEDK